VFAFGAKMLLLMLCLNFFLFRNAYEIVFGGWSNTQSVIRESFQGTNRATQRQNGVVSCSEERLALIQLTFSVHNTKQ
jgi:hypothetical protein